MRKSLCSGGGEPFSAAVQADFRRAYLTFRHQLVYEPDKVSCPSVRVFELYLLKYCFCQGCLVPIFPVPPELAGEDLSFTGHPLPPAVARAVAAGDIDPSTRLPFDGQPDMAIAPASNAVTAAASGAGAPANAVPAPAEIQGASAASPNSTSTAASGLAGRQAKITSLFGLRAAVTNPLSVARAGPLPSVSAYASREFRPPRPAVPEDTCGESRPSSTSTDESMSPAVYCRENEANDDSGENQPQPPALKRARGWTANPFASVAKKRTASAVALR